MVLPGCTPIPRFGFKEAPSAFCKSSLISCFTVLVFMEGSLKLSSTGSDGAFVWSSGIESIWFDVMLSFANEATGGASDPAYIFYLYKIIKWIN